MGELVVQQMNEFERRIEQKQHKLAQTSEGQELEIVQKRERQEHELVQIIDLQERRERGARIGPTVKEIRHSWSDEIEKTGDDAVPSGATTSKPIWTRDEYYFAGIDSPVKRKKVELRCNERMLDVDELFQIDDYQSDRRTDTKIM